MREFLLNSGGTLFVLILVISAVFFSVKKLIKNKKNGKCSCGCENCSFKDNCHKKI